MALKKRITNCIENRYFPLICIYRGLCSLFVPVKGKLIRVHPVIKKMICNRKQCELRKV